MGFSVTIIGLHTYLVLTHYDVLYLVSRASVDLSQQFSVMGNWMYLWEGLGLTTIVIDCNQLTFWYRNRNHDMCSLSDKL